MHYVYFANNQQYINKKQLSAPLSKKRSCHAVTEELEKLCTMFTSLTINNISTKRNFVLRFVKEELSRSD